MIYVLQASNLGALNLYAKFGFVKEELMAKYYLNSGNAFRLKLWIDNPLQSNASTIGGIRATGGNGTETNRETART